MTPYSKENGGPLSKDIFPLFLAHINLRTVEVNMEDAYSHTGGIFIPDTAYSLWFNEAYDHI